MENMARVINATPNAAIQVPVTKYKIKQLIQSNIKSEFHIKCKKCSNFIASLTNEIKCTFCGTLTKTTNSEYFVYIPIEHQLKQSVEANIDDILNYYSKIRNQDQISDIHNGELFKNAQKLRPNTILLPIIVNTDGVKVFRVQTKSLWLILFYQCYLSPPMRYKPSNVLIVAAHFGCKKPDMKTFFYPFLKDMNEIQIRGGFSMIHNGKQVQFMPLILGASCDLPAKAQLQGMIGHCGKFACGYCLHPGVAIKSGKSTVIRYIKGDYLLRTHNEFIQICRQLRSDSMYGIKTVSSMVAANGFDLINGFAIDPMHCVFLGVVKKIFNLWLDSKNHLESFYISKKKQVILSNRLVKLKPPSEIVRRPRSLFSRADYKANEYRAFLLYFMPFALVGLHDTKYVKHFQSLCSAIYLLSKESVSNVEIQNARCKLIKFANDFETLYGISNVTLNLHLIRHLASVVEYLGPLWVFTAFAFEARNGIVAKGNTCTNNILHQLAWKYTLKISKNDSSEKVGDFSINGKKTKKMNLMDRQILFDKVQEEQHFLIIYKSIIVRGIKFTSLESKDILTIDYFVRLKNGLFGAINFYTIFDNIIYAIINLYECIESFDHFDEIKSTGNSEVVKVTDFDRKLIYLKFGIREFVTLLANRYEKS